MDNTPAPPLPPIERHYSPTEFADIVGLSLSTIRAQIRSGRIRARKLGRRLAIPESAIREYLAQSDLGSRG